MSRIEHRIVAALRKAMTAKTASERVVARVLKSASFLEIGDIVLYGKYKNGRAIIVGWGKDKWGNPTVLLEGVKSKKKMEKQLFTVWKAEIKDKAMAEAEAAAKAKLASSPYIDERPHVFNEPDQDGNIGTATCPNCQTLSHFRDDTQDDLICSNCGTAFNVDNTQL